jgi:hypothetical protein
VRALQARRQCLARILILEGHSPPDLAHQSVQHASGAAPASTPRIGRRTRAALQAGDAAKHVESGLPGYDHEGQESLRPMGQDSTRLDKILKEPPGSTATTYEGLPREGCTPSEWRVASGFHATSWQSMGGYEGDRSCASPHLCWI